MKRLVMPPLPTTLGVVLAGGRATRMGGADKPLLRLAGRTLLDRIVERLAPQCSSVIISANGDPARFGETGLPVIPDDDPDHPGPLAGLLAAMDWAAAQTPHIAWIVTVPGDTPFLPEDLVRRLHEERQGADTLVACAVSGERIHPVVGLWSTDLRRDLRHALTVENERGVRRWAERHGIAHAVWPAEPSDPFFNINTPEDLHLAEDLLEQHSQHPQSPATELDLSGLKCPLPVLRTRKALHSLAPGNLLRVTCTDPLAGIDIPNLIRETGDVIEHRRQDGRQISFTIRKAGRPA